MIGTLGELFLHGVGPGSPDEQEFLRECYCTTGALSQFSLVNRSILRARYSTLLGEDLELGLKSAREKEGLAPEIVERVASAAHGRRPIILLGDVGVGKTMLLRHLLRVDAADLSADAVLLYVDLGEAATLTDLKVVVVNELTRQLRESYNTDIDEYDFLLGTYQQEVQRFRKGADKPIASSDPSEFERRLSDRLRTLTEDPEQHLGRSLNHLVTLRRQQVIIVLDNVDQRSAADQEAIFLIANAMAANWPATTFLTLRPETFHASRSSGTLRAYQPEAYTVAPPRVEQVVTARLEYGLRHLERDGQLPTWVGWTTNSALVKEYATLLLNSFRRNEKLKVLLENMSGGNVRRGLELVRGFVTSPHSAPLQALDRWDDGQGFDVPHHVFLRSILLGSAQHYDPAASEIPNLFDIVTPDPREHFLLGAMLGHLRRAADHTESEGFVPTSVLVENLHGAGFSAHQIEFGFARIRAGALADYVPPNDTPRAWRLSTIGAYLHSQIGSEYQYLDAVVIDTPITDSAIRGSLEIARSTRKRIARVESFVAYLDACWESFPLKDEGLFDWPAHSTRVRQEIAFITDRLAD